jgi:hypothetical protein
LTCIEKQLSLGYVVGAAIALWGIVYGLYLQGEDEMGKGNNAEGLEKKERATLLLHGVKSMYASRK